jgi:hypothetical protein
MIGGLPSRYALGFWKGGLLLAVLFLIIFGTLATAAVSGSWNSKITLAPTVDAETNPITGLSSTLKFDFFSTKGNITSSSVFNKDDGYYSQSFGVDWRMGTLDIDSTLAFLPAVPRMDYWLTKTGAVMAGAYISTTLLVEYEAKEEVFGTGMEFVVSGETPTGMAIEVTTMFGMEEDLVEILGWQIGSGYDIVLTGRENSPCQLCYTDTTIEVSGLTVGCCKLDATAKLNGEEGFEYILFEFLLALEDLSLTFDVDLQYALQDKTITLTPSLGLGTACLDIYLDPIPLELDRDDNQITGLELKGVGIMDVDLGSSVTFSSLTALKGHLWHSKTATSNIPLRARDYILEPDPLDKVYYTETPYDEVISIECNDGLSFGFDFYFNMAESDKFFDVSLFTGEFKYRLCDQFTLGSGISVDPESGPGRFTVSFGFYF